MLLSPSISAVSVSSAQRRNLLPVFSRARRIVLSSKYGSFVLGGVLLNGHVCRINVASCIFKLNSRSREFRTLVKLILFTNFYDYFRINRVNKTPFMHFELLFADRRYRNNANFWRVFVFRIYVLCLFRDDRKLITFERNRLESLKIRSTKTGINSPSDEGD